MDETYTVAMMMADMMETITAAGVYIVPAAIITGCAAFVIAWFMDAVDIAGRTFGRHR